MVPAGPLKAIRFGADILASSHRTRIRSQNHERENERVRDQPNLQPGHYPHVTSLSRISDSSKLS